ncbi:hypothetical protein HOV30_gp035 [Erwinia phage Derbicus]|uniref:Uncharacterized protein n=2 Tax=Derbicusvirus derbicus TaxID=2734104 RepID=A0A482IHI2_9CAUD|nr:hypothetical protein BIZ82_gp035 [Erwinia phage vB_EamM_EarlPhillipIV]YP_009821079.1 hypothetical protein HOV30_gp035 [Erwinia phage Derbicus]ANZ48885.1 hypothetical protein EARLPHILLIPIV_35 [Erwinia phage vB_EamM_EarlPhillipIV]QBP07461.1 hypothetical protein DERBICUS_35 [Erwinia phage Derbicus]QXO09756.1 hypothetical protein pEaSNUABM38_00034 [Erwinia phage pEa_SNUABM_38]
MLDNFVTYEAAIPALSTIERQLIIDHLDYLRNHPSTKARAVDPRYSYPEMHSFYAYCSLVDIPSELIFPTMLLNNIRNPMEFTPDMETLLIPDIGVVASILDSAVV